MSAFDFVITLLSFVFSLALTHLLFGIARITRHRRTVKLSGAHAIWTANTLVLIVLNWLSLWDFRGQTELSIVTVASGVIFSILLYLTAAFVTPDVDDPEGRDLRQFHERESVTYIGATLAVVLVSFVVNEAAVSEGVTVWATQNLVVLIALVPVTVALAVRKGRIHILASAVCLAVSIAFLALYYSTLR